MKNLILIWVLLVSVRTHCQTYKQRNYEETIHGLTTIINIYKPDNRGAFGTGFFYHKYSLGRKTIDSCFNAVDSSLESIWLVTNKHVLFGSDSFQRANPTYPVRMEFFLRKKIKNSSRPIWDTIRIRGLELKELTKLHNDTLVDVIAIEVTKFVLPKLLKGDSLYVYGAVSNANFPNENLPVTLHGFGITLGQEILSVGYPRNFYDRYNLFPTIKAGIIASKWNARFGGNPYFLIDSKLFPGSSGSVIITRPVHYGIEKELLPYFNFLGVYSGEPFRDSRPIEFDDITIIRRETYNIGIVWYYWLIEEIIK